MEHEAAARRTPGLNETQATPQAPPSGARTAADPATGAPPPPSLPGVALGERWRLAGGAPSALPEGDRYAVEQQLGEGSYGRVYAVRDRDLERVIAVKMLAEPGFDAAQLERFVAEARLMARMDHPNVLPVYDVGLADGCHPFIAMKRIHGRTLGSRLEQVRGDPGARGGEPLTPGQAVAIIIQVCQAVSYAHHRGIVHLDIKPENIMLGSFGEVLVMDWGSASAMKPDAPRGPTGGTPLYMSPEQARGGPAAPSHDIYAVGATLFHALTGRPPTWSNDPEAFWAMKRSGTIQGPTAAEHEAVGAPLLAIARKALAAEARDRYASIDELREDLQRYQDGLAITAYRDGLASYLLRFVRAHRQLVWFLAAFLALASLAGAAAYRHWQLEQSSWKLVASEDFDRPVSELEKDWRTSSCSDFTASVPAMPEVPMGTRESWFIVPGGIGTDNHSQVVDLTYRHALPQDWRVEWTYQGHGSGQNLNCYFGHDRLSGYTLHVGGWGDPRSVILTRGPAYARVDWARMEPLQAERLYRFRLEREGPHLRCAIDGRVVIDYTSMGGMDAPADPTIGFDSFDGSLFITGVRIYERKAAELVSPLTTPDEFFAVGDFRHALERYRLLAETHAGTEIGTRASFGAALCVARMQGESAGERALEGFVTAHADDALAPFAQWERLRIAAAAGEHAREQQILGALSAYRGQGILRAVLADRCEHFRHLMMPRLVRTLADDPWPADARPQLQSALDDVEHWCAAFGVDRHDLGWTSESENILISLGGADFVSAHSLDPMQKADALRTLGRFDDIISAAGAPNEARQEARSVRMQAGPADSRAVMERLFAGYHGPGNPDTDRQIAHDTASLHRDATADLARTEHGDPWGLRPWSLAVEGRVDDLVRFYPWDTEHLENVGMALVESGDAARGWALLEPMAARTWYCPEADLSPEVVSEVGFGHCIAPSLWPFFRRGMAVDLRAALGPRLGFFKGICCQTVWHDARYLLGDEDEATFLAQPMRFMAANRLALMQGIKAELDHQPAVALEAYERVQPARREPWYGAHFASWRRRELAARAP